MANTPDSSVAHNIAHAARLTDWRSSDPLSAFVRLLEAPARKALDAALRAREVDLGMEEVAAEVFRRAQEYYHLDLATVAGVILLSGVDGYFTSETSSSRVIFRDGRDPVEECFGEHVDAKLDRLYGRLDDFGRPGDDPAVALVQGQGHYFTPDGGMWDAIQWVEARTAVRRTPFDTPSQD